MANNSQVPFNPLGETVAIAADAVAPAGVQAQAEVRFRTYAPGEYRVVNSGTELVHLGVGVSASAAQSNAVAAISGNPSSAIPLMPGAVEVLRLGPDSYFSGLAAAATTVYITPGQGL